MNLSSRWCVTVVVALGALACSDPVPPPAQGAFRASVNSASVPGKSCPSGAGFQFDVPAQTSTVEQLSTSQYKHHIVDGEDSASVACSVKGSSTFTFSGRIAMKGKVLEVSDGTLGADKKGTARVALLDTTSLSQQLASPSANCTIDAASDHLMAQPGAIWGHFECADIEAPPANACKADGEFVFENCAQ